MSSKLKPPAKVTKLFLNSIKVENKFREAKVEYPVIETGLKRKLAEDATENQPNKTPKTNKITNVKESARVVATAVTKKENEKKPVNSNVKASVPKTAPSKTVTTRTGTVVTRTAVAKKKAEPVTAKPAAKVASKTTATKRPQWDTKGRLQDMEELATNLQVELKNSQESYEELKVAVNASNAQVASLEQFKKELLESMNAHATSLKNSGANEENIVEELKKLVTEKEEQLKQEKASLLSSHKVEIEALENRVKILEKEKEDLEDKVRSQKSKINSLEDVVSNQGSAELAMKAKLTAVEAKYDVATKNFTDEQKKCTALETELQEASDQILKLEEKIRADEQIRRRLHNTIQELKGNIRVFCRVRPLLDSEKESEMDPYSHLFFPENDDKIIQLNQSGENAEGKAKSNNYEFNFDKVFQPKSTQEDCFEEISQLVQSACDGYNVCIFAYGQTNSGKTFTMEGTSENQGMIPRSVLKVWEESKRLEEKGWKYTMEGSFVEIYNESIRDLLSNDFNDRTIDIKTDKKGGPFLPGVTNENLTSPEQVSELLKRASNNRAVAATNCNDRSSRSHSVFMMRISGRNNDLDEECEGMLNLIDLAGSERLANSNATGDRLKETQNINKSLSSLSTVFTAIANKDQHIPYRNSKLTHLLQNSLGGNSKSLMFVNINPCLSSLHETLCSLRFAVKVNNCQIGTAIKNVK